MRFTKIKKDRIKWSLTQIYKSSLKTRHRTVLITKIRAWLITGHRECNRTGNWTGHKTRHRAWSKS